MREVKSTSGVGNTCNWARHVSTEGKQGQYMYASLYMYNGKLLRKKSRLVDISLHNEHNMVRASNTMPLARQSTRDFSPPPQKA